MTSKTKDNSAEGAKAVAAAIASMSDDDRLIAEKLHKIILDAAPSLAPRTWYGMPAYTKKTEGHGDKIVCFFRSRQKFGERYMTIGFNDIANLDEGNMWPIYYALTKLTDSEEKAIAALIKKAVS